MSAPARAVAGMWGSWGGGRRRRDGGGAVDGEEALGIPVDTPLLYAVVPAAGSGGGDGRARGCCGGIDGVRRIVGRCALLLVAPPSFLRSMDSLRFTSALAVVSLVFMTLVTVHSTVGGQIILSCSSSALGTRQTRI